MARGIGRITQEFDGDYYLDRSRGTSGRSSVRARQAYKFPDSTHRVHLHKAIDYHADIGTPVLAVADGKIVGQGQYPGGSGG